MAHPEGASSNSLFEILADWESILRDTSLNPNLVSNSNTPTDCDPEPKAIRHATRRLYGKGA
jgi:hypothetical protein